MKAVASGLNIFLRPALDSNNRLRCHDRCAQFPIATLRIQCTTNNSLHKITFPEKKYVQGAATKNIIGIDLHVEPFHGEVDGAWTFRRGNGVMCSKY